MAAKIKVQTRTTGLEVLEKLGFTEGALRRAKAKPFKASQRAKLLDVPIAALKLPILLTPAKPIAGKSSLTLYSCMMMDPTWPAASGQALFSSIYPGAVFPGAQVSFPRVKKGKKHLVEFHVTLNASDVTYQFRIFRYPLGEFQDVAVTGGHSEVLLALCDPVDQISGSLDLGAAISQRNPKSDFAGWTLHSVNITTTS